MKRRPIRWPESVQGRAHRLACQDQVSMNQFMVTAISNEIVRQETHAFFKPWVATFDEAAFLQALEAIPDIPPERRDRRPRTVHAVKS